LGTEKRLAEEKAPAVSAVCLRNERRDKEYFMIANHKTRVVGRR
jgi:hypothetical protein